MKGAMANRDEALIASLISKPEVLSTKTSSKDVKKHEARRNSRGLRRPKNPLSFQITSAPQAGTSSAASSIRSLERRVLLLNLIIRRNKNQHRAQPFFKHLCLLRSSLVRLLSVQGQLEATLGLPATKAEEVRKKFEREANLRSQKEVLEEHGREVLVPKCYVTFSGLVTDSQFGNLGIVLIGLLSEVAVGEDGLGLMRNDEIDVTVVDVRGERALMTEDVGEKVERGLKASLLGRSTRMTGEDQGEVVERKYGHGQESVVEETVDISNGSGDSKHVGELNKAESAQAEHRQEVRVSVSQPQADDNMPRRTKPETAQQLDHRPLSPEKEKKKRKKKSAIDDLFSGLL